MKPNFAKKILGHVAVSSELTKRALDELQVHRSAQTKAAALRSDLLKRLVETGCVGEHQKQAAEAMLGSHAETMGLLKAAVDKLAVFQAQLQKQAGDLGQGVDPKDAGSTKTASYDSLNDPFVGRKTSQRKASDDAIAKVLQ